MSLMNLVSLTKIIVLKFFNKIWTSKVKNSDIFCVKFMVYEK